MIDASFPDPAVAPDQAAAPDVDELSLQAAQRRARLALALAAVAAALLVLLDAGLGWQALQATDALEQREFELVRRARSLEGEVPEMVAAGRSYLLTQDPAALDEFGRDRDEARAALAQLRELASADDQRALLDPIGAQLRDVTDRMERRLTLARQGRLEEARAG